MILAKQIEDTPVLQGKDAERFMKILRNPKRLTKAEREIRKMLAVRAETEKLVGMMRAVELRTMKMILIEKIILFFKEQERQHGSTALAYVVNKKAVQVFVRQLREEVGVEA